MGRIGVVGVGHSRFGKRSDASLRELAFEAYSSALDDADIDSSKIDGSVVCSATHYDKQRSPAGVVAEYLGLNPQPTFNVEAACASSAVGLRTAWALVSSKLHDVVAIVGVQKMTELSSEEIQELMGRAGDVMWESPFGTTMPAYYAMYATAHMAKYGTTEEQMALVTVKNRKYGMKNPNAMFQKPISAEEVLKSRPVSSPLKLFDCCPNADGAACLIIANAEKTRKLTDKPVWVAGLGLASSPMSLAGRKGPLTSFEVTKNAAKAAYNMARVRPNDVDVAEVHDSFSITEILNYEDLGFAKPGGGTRLLEKGETELGGRIPVNIDGGLISKGHPVGATGASQLFALTKQLRGEAGSTQVDGAKIGLAQNIGGIGMYCSVTILRS
ncbi:MAG: acetyl-CoA acetyltransferase [Crenarchaeota archaeon 13_1_40CM_3_52_17]|nr:MAG: acetyl-CoA acetyltransferase [Crenarchaeota archaeon 13_1_40CM_3_52_17]